MYFKMNSKHVRYITCAACSVVLGVGAMSFDSEAAAPVSGIFAMTTTNCAVEKTSQDKETIYSGVTLAFNNALAGNASASESVATAGVVKTAFTSYEDVAICTVEDSLNVRKAPDENSEVVGKMYKNCAASIIGMEGDWYKISSGNVVGYVKRQYMVVGNAELAKSVSKRLATVTAAAIDVYEQPDTNSVSIAKYPQGEALLVVDESVPGWVKVSCENGDGYIMSNCLSLSTEYVLAESKAEEQARIAKEEAERQAAAAQALKLKQQQAKNNTKTNSKSTSSKSSSGSGRSYSSASGSGGSAVVAYGSQFVGNPYVYGGSSLTNGTDCSGFVMSVYGAYGVSLPHSSYAMANCGYAVSQDDMQPGDLVIYSGHVGIYAGDGQLLHASNERTGITYSNVNYRPIQTVRRIY